PVISCLFIFSLLLSLTLISSFFPYTTLFRSKIKINSFRLRLVALISKAVVLVLNQNQHIMDSTWYTVLLHLHSVGRWIVLLLLRSEEHTSELQSRSDIVCRLLLEKKNNINKI